jgi:hypothetical protein
MSSIRERAHRLNMGVFVSGGSGSGKSRMTERLSEPWRRVIYVDPMRSFRTATVETWPDAVTSLATFWKTPGALKFGASFTSDEDYAKFFGALAALMKHSRGANPNFLLVVDEIDLWSSPQHLDANLSYIFRYGRHYGCSWIANCRADVQTHRDVRMNAAEILLFRQGMVSPEIQKMVKAAEMQRGILLPAVWTLTMHGRSEPPSAVEGTHFLALPEPFADWLPRWHALATDAP